MTVPEASSNASIRPVRLSRTLLASGAGSGGAQSPKLIHQPRDLSALVISAAS